MDEGYEEILKLYRRFQEEPDEETAMRIEEKLDLMRMCTGYIFRDLVHVHRIGRDVSRYLDKIENAKRMAEFVESDWADNTGKTMNEVLGIDEEDSECLITK